ncbi:hypothetical protein [Neisseria polysaccharea]|uniref:hypothetical protein n=1 Tax=Neisseria polysaccharea TaxID=489 RepID=UPI00031CB3FA
MPSESVSDGIFYFGACFFVPACLSPASSIPFLISSFPCLPQHFVIPATFRHSRENGNLESLKLQLTFKYCRRPKV